MLTRSPARSHPPKYSAVKMDTHEALLATYAVWGLWLLGLLMLDQFNRATGWFPGVPGWAADPYLLAFAPYWRPGTVDWPDYVYDNDGNYGAIAMTPTERGWQKTRSSAASPGSPGS